MLEQRGDKPLTDAEIKQGKDMLDKRQKKPRPAPTPPRTLRMTGTTRIDPFFTERAKKENIRISH